MYYRTTVGNVESCRTEVEIRDESNKLVAIVYEDPNGWHTEFSADRDEEGSLKLQSSIETAQSELAQYVNRKGENPPQDLSVGALSLWLLCKDDGSIFGMTPDQLAKFAKNKNES